MKIYLDFETYSPTDLKVSGAFKYAQDPLTEVLLVGYSLDDPNNVKVVEPLDPQLNELFEAIKSGATVTAHNAPFEKAIWDNVGMVKYGWPAIELTQWRCTAAKARALGLPSGLDDLATAINGTNKDKAGAALITKYCKPTKAGLQRHLHDNLDDLEAFKAYCQKDVQLTVQLDRELLDLSPYELNVFHHDMMVNERGIPIDLKTLHNAQRIIADLEQHFEDESMKIVGFKATQRNKVLDWLMTKGIHLPNLLVETVEGTLIRDDVPPDVKHFLELRYEASRVGTKKAKKMLDMVCNDGTIKGSFLYHSATTGRWGSRGVQLQNLGKPDTQAMQDQVIEILQNGTAKDMLAAFPRPLTAISKSMRGFIKSPNGYRFLIADYATIEAKVLAWLTGEESLMDSYRQGLDVYKQMASKIYEVPVDQITPPQRRIGKTTILGCGYGMGYKKFHADCETNKLGISLSESKHIIEVYRDSVPAIPDYWDKANRAVIQAITSKKKITVNKCSFFVKDKFLHFELPSGRLLGFYEPRITVNDWDKPQVTVTGFFNGKKSPETLWGGIITQNLCQATARDLMVNGLLTGEANGYPIHMHVHDEIVSMLPDGVGSIGDFEQQICSLPSWASDFPLSSEGFEATRYQK